jgi:hypothetical protein
MTITDIILIIMALLFVLSIPLALLGNTIYECFNHKHKKKHQHKMFKELKKGDYIWKLYGDYIEALRITKINYYFDKQDNIQEIHISTSDWTTIHLEPQQTNTFKLKEGTYEYYTIFKEAETKRMLTEMKRNKSINEFNTINQQDKINALNKEIKELQKLKQDTFNKLNIN